MTQSAIVNIDIQDKLPRVASGKVRDLYAIDDDTLLFVASDRISAYDVIMENVSPLQVAQEFSISRLIASTPSTLQCCNTNNPNHRAYPAKAPS